MDWVLNNLVSALEGLGAPWGLPDDWILCADLDALRDFPPRMRRKWLKKAKVEVLRRAIQARVDEIAEAAENEDSIGVEVLLAAFPSDIGNFAGLTEAERKKWIKRVETVAQARLRSYDRQVDGPCIYILSTEDEFVKIGFTTNLAARLRSLRTASPKTVQVNLVIPGTRQDERDLHYRFAAYRVRGEWFRYSDSIRDFVDSYNSS